MVDSVLGVVNELLGTALSKLGPIPPLPAPSPSPTPLAQGGAVPRTEEGAEFWGFQFLLRLDEAGTRRRCNGGVRG